MAQIHINQNTCIRCKKCVRICPSALFTLQEDKGIEVNAEDCISCGHCVAVCPTNSIEHTDFPAEKVHTIDRSQLPTADQRKSLGRVVTAYHRSCPSGPDGNQCTRSQNGIGHPPGNLEGGQPCHHRHFYVDSKLGGKSVTEIDIEAAYAFGLSLRAGVQKTA